VKLHLCNACASLIAAGRENLSGCKDFIRIEG